MAKRKLELVRQAESKPAQEQKRNSNGKGNKAADEAAERKLAPRTRVRKAQLSVLEKVESILEGNCESAKKGNHGCAKFVLEWSGVSDLRTPLAKPKRKSSLADALLKKLKQAAEQPPEADGAPEQK
jgi:hypothetical protein